MTTTITFKTVDEALAAVEAARPVRDDIYGFDLPGGGAGMADGTVLLIDNPEHGMLTALVVVGNAAYATGINGWHPGNVGEIPMLAGDTPTNHNMLAQARYTVQNIRLSRRKDEVRRRVIEAVNAQLAEGETHATIDDKGRITMLGHSVWNLDVVEERRHISSFRSERNGKLRVTVGGYGNRKSFPQRKDGTHDYAGIATHLIACQRGYVASAERDARMAANHQHVQAVRETSPGFVWDTNATDDPARPVRVSRTVSFSGAFEETTAFMAAVNAAVDQFSKKE